MKCIKQKVCWIAPVLLLAAQSVFAHPLHGDAAGGFAGGLAHPLLGIDHMLVMVAVGVWAAQSGGAAVWKVPLAFVVTLLVGAVAGLAGIGLPGIEPMIAASVVVLGLVISARARLAPWLAGLLVAAFALFHGQAHMAELPVGASALTYIIGFALTTALLHGAGIVAGYLLHRHTEGALLRAGGMGLAGVGMWWLVGV
jgi:urease accessory protein